MAQNPDVVEKMAVDLKCDAPRVTKELIESRIVAKEFVTIELCGNKFMYCGLKMDNGFVVVGKPAACVSPENWRDEIGQKVSYDNAFSEIWRLEAYRMMSA